MKKKKWMMMAVMVLALATSGQTCIFAPAPRAHWSDR